MPALGILPFGIGPGELIIVLVIVLIIFGPKRLPQLGKSLGETVRAIRKGSEGEGESEEEEGPAGARKSESAAGSDEEEE